MMKFDTGYFYLTSLFGVASGGGGRGGSYLPFLGEQWWGSSLTIYVFMEKYCTFPCVTYQKLA